MNKTVREQHWLAVVADATAATVHAVSGEPPHAALVATAHIRYKLDALGKRTPPPELARFVAEHHLAGCTAHLRFTGAGTVVHKLHMPSMTARRRARAIRTRLTTYAAGRELAIGEQLDPRRRSDKEVHVLAAGVDVALARGLRAALRNVGLHPGTTTALTAACRPPADQGYVVQVVVNERTTAIQLFTDGRLAFCRDVLLGRADFVAAYRRPILTDHGPLTLSLEQADQLTRDVGVPLGLEQTTLKSVGPNELWPLITPVLERLRNEVQQTLAQYWEPSEPATLSVLCLPRIPRLGAHLANVLRLVGPLLPDERVEDEYLLVLRGASSQTSPIDLSPPEDRFVRRMRWPALAAGACAAAIVLSNAQQPRVAQAEVRRLEPASAALQDRLDHLQAQLAAAQQEYDQLVADLATRARLIEALPTSVPAVEISRALLQTVPENVELLEARLDAASTPAAIELRASYRGRLAAGVVAADWARHLAESTPFTNAQVASVDGSGRDACATIVIKAELH